MHLPPVLLLTLLFSLFVSSARSASSYPFCETNNHYLSPGAVEGIYMHIHQQRRTHPVLAVFKRRSLSSTHTLKETQTKQTLSEG